jgi:hypothetical protein
MGFQLLAFGLEPSVRRPCRFGGTAHRIKK